MLLESNLEHRIMFPKSRVFSLIVLFYQHDCTDSYGRLEICGFVSPFELFEQVGIIPMETNLGSISLSATHS